MNLYYTKWVFSKFQKQRNRIVLITFKKINPVFKPQKKIEKKHKKLPPTKTAEGLKHTLLAKDKIRKLNDRLLEWKEKKTKFQGLIRKGNLL